MDESVAVKIVEMIADLREDVGGVKKQNEMILTQTTKTNGSVLDLQHRVTVLETDKATASGAKSVKSSAWGKMWEVGKIILAAGVGAAFASMKTR